MSSYQDSSRHDGPPTVRIGAGTAIKIGFFGAFGALLFSIVCSIVLAIIVLILGAAGLLTGIGQFWVF